MVPTLVEKFYFFSVLVFIDPHWNKEKLSAITIYSIYNLLAATLQGTQNKQESEQ